MAMIFDLELPRAELDAIAAFMRGDAESDVAELGELGTKVLGRLTKERRGLWGVVIGDFVEYEIAGRDEERGRNTYTDQDGKRVAHADALCDPETGKSTGRYGIVVENYIDPAAAFEIGVPI